MFSVQQLTRVVSGSSALYLKSLISDRTPLPEP